MSQSPSAGRLKHLVAHRGAPREFPGNTLAGFARAIELGCTMLECDVRLSSDGMLVLAHDETVTTSSGETLHVASAPSEKLARLDLGRGEGVPSLRELVDLVDGRVAIMADMKCEGNGVEAAVAAALSALPPELKLVPGAAAESRRRLRQADAHLPLSFSLGAYEARGLSEAGLLDLAASAGTDAVTWEHPLLTASLVSQLHTLGLEVFAWTVDDRADMSRLISIGVDGIISNRPDLLVRLLAGD